jgi:phosphoglycolate phosphatase-like HAD superfamily hydrolase
VPRTTSLALFDIDGTLIRRAGPHHKQALIAGIREVTGVETDMEGIATAGTLDRDLITLMLGQTGWNRADIANVLRDIMTACHTSYGENCPADLRDRVCPGLPDLLDELKSRGATLGVVSGNLREIGRRKLELAGLWSYFSVSAFSEDGHTRSELAREAAKQAGLRENASSFGLISLVGDHPNDVAAAKANGFRSVAVATGLSSAEELAAVSPDLLLQDLREADPAYFFP